jgi:hypothetical protein
MVDEFFGPAVVVLHDVPSVTVACPLCSTYVEMPFEPPFPAFDDEEGMARLSTLAVGFAFVLREDCQWATTLSHFGIPDPTRPPIS